MAKEESSKGSVMQQAMRACTQVATIVFRLGRVYRQSFHEDGRTPESDNDHTVMLGVAACAFAARHMPRLDVGKIAQYALVHELVEAYAGDTNTLRVLTPGDALEKRRREEAALERISSELGDAFPWVTAMIWEYESKATPEARYVKAFDKHMGAIANVVNGGVTLRGHNLTKEQVRAVYDAQKVAAYASDMPELLALREAILQEMLSMEW